MGVSLPRWRRMLVLDDPRVTPHRHEGPNPGEDSSPIHVGAACMMAKGLHLECGRLALNTRTEEARKGGAVIPREEIAAAERGTS